MFLSKICKNDLDSILRAASVAIKLKSSGGTSNSEEDSSMLISILQDQGDDLFDFMCDKKRISWF